MDPLSVTASIIAVLGLVHKITTLCLELHALKGAKQDLNRILDEIESLRTILEGLARLVSNQNSSSSTDFETINKPDGPLAACREELEKLRNDLQKVSGSKFGMPIVSWALKEKELARRLNSLARAKQSLQLSLAVDQTAIILKSRDNSLSLQSAIEDISTEQQRRSIVDWLGLPYPSSAFNDAQQVRSVDTGEWFLKGSSFDHWKKSPQSILWINGIPGSGKTVLVSSVIRNLMDSLQPNDDNLLVYFFFDFAARDKRIVSLFLRSLLSQIVVQRKTAVGPIQALYNHHHGGFQEPSIRTLLDSLRTVFDEAKDVYVVIDAVDECSERGELLEIIEEFHDWKLKNVHLCATSRKEKDIDETFVRLGSEQLRLEGKDINEDIQKYVSRRVLRERWLQKWPAKVQDEITGTIVKKAGEMFRLATFQLDELKKCRTVHALRTALHSLPTTLDETYCRILSSIEPEFTQSAVRILSWLCFAFYPPTLNEVAEALAVDLEKLEYDAEQRLQDAEDVLLICKSLVMRTGQSSSVLKLSHFSVKEYLMSNRILGTNLSCYYITSKLADVRIARICLIYLKGCHHKHGDEAIDVLSATHPLLVYATNFWSEHFGRAGENPELLLLALELLCGAKSRFLNWAWLASIVPGGFYTEFPQLKSLRNTNWDILLYFSALIGNQKLIDGILDRGASINSEGGVYGTALSVAAYKGDVASAQLLLKRGADVNVQSGHWGNALQAAVAHGWIEMAKLLVSHGANVNVRGGRHLTSLSAAFQAVENSNDLIQLLIDSGAEVTLAERHHATTPSAVNYTGLKPIARLQHDIDPDLANSRALNFALSRGDIGLADSLLIQNSTTGPCSPILLGRAILAAATHGLSTLKFMVEKWRADTNWSGGSEGTTVLHYVALTGTADQVQYLLSLGMDVNQKDFKGWSAIHYAALSTTSEKLKLLLPKWRPEKSESNRWSPLHLACQRNVPEALDLLSNAGVSPSTVTTSEPQWQWTLFDIASVYQNEKLVSENGQALHNILLDAAIPDIERPVMETGSYNLCDGCQFGNATHMIGPTFHCGECPDFDYCFKCRLTAEETHPHDSWSVLETNVPPNKSYAYIDTRPLCRY